MIVENPRSVFIRKCLAHGFLCLFLLLLLFPFAMVISISFREGNFTTGSLIPERPTLEHWYLAFGLDYTRSDGTLIEPPFPVMTWMWNSIKIAFFSASGVLAISTISAYAFSRIQFRGRQGLLDSLFIIQLFPSTLALVALYAVFDSFGEISPALGIDNHLPLVAVYLSGVMMHIWTIKGYFDGIDSSLDKAAAVDGATPWQSFVHIYLPLAVPIMSVVFVLVFVSVINDYPLASILIRSEEKMTLAVGSRLYLNEFKYLWGDFAAAAILSGLPITAVFLMAQKYLISGLSDGAVKG